MTTQKITLASIEANDDVRSTVVLDLPSTSPADD